MLCFVLWALCCSFLSIKIYVCTWVDLLFVNNLYFNLIHNRVWVSFHHHFSLLWIKANSHMYLASPIYNFPKHISWVLHKLVYNLYCSHKIWPNINHCVHDTSSSHLVWYLFQISTISFSKLGTCSLLNWTLISTSIFSLFDSSILNHFNI